MTWIKTKDLTPPTHEVILFQDKSRNIHYGVLCGEFSEEEKREKYWCHIFEKSYSQKDIIYWCEIPINKHLVSEHMEFSAKVNKFLWDTVSRVEESILDDFKRQRLEHPEWDAENFVGIAVRNSSHRILDILKVTKCES